MARVWVWYKLNKNRVRSCHINNPTLCCRIVCNCLMKKKKKIVLPLDMANCVSLNVSLVFRAFFVFFWHAAHVLGASPSCFFCLLNKI